MINHCWGGAKMEAIHREISKEFLTTDVLVVGGGTAGCHAAVAASQEGASVILVEMDGAVGGVATRANISTYHYGSRGGLQDWVDKQVISRQRQFGGQDFLSHPEAKRSVLSEMLEQNQVRVLLNSIAYDVIVEDNRVAGVCLAGPGGLKEIRAKITIDCTADGDIAAAAGASFTIGRELDGVSHLYSLAPRIVKKHPKTGLPQIGQINFDAGWVHSIDVRDVSYAYMEGRQHLLDYLTEGAEAEQDRHLLSIAPKLGVREGRHIIGDYVMNLEDFMYDRHFDDVVIRSCSHYDTHARDMGNESDFAQEWLVVLDMFVKGHYWCDVPYRCLLPQGVNGLLVASRALSVDREVSMGVRMQRDIQKLGVAAAMSARDKVDPRQVSLLALQSKLVERGVLKQTDLGRSYTDNLSFQEGPLSGRRFSIDDIHILDPVAAVDLALELSTYIGGKEESIAIWWLVQLGQVSVAPLTLLMDSAQVHPIRRSAAYGLALLGSKEAVSFLMNMLREREDNRPDHLKSYPKWVSAVILLRMLGHAEAYSEIMVLLEENHSASINTMILQYLEQTCDQLKPETRRELGDRLKRWIDRPEVGNDYVAQGELVTTSLRWNLASWAGLILARLGDEAAIRLCEEYVDHPRLYIRLAVEIALQKIRKLLAEASLKGCETA
jgi:hypothetical protein